MTSWIMLIVISFGQCQRIGNLFKRHEMRHSGILKVEIFDVWGIGLMGPFPPSHKNFYIIVPVDYISKWLEAFLPPLVSIPRWSLNSSKRISSQDLAHRELSLVTMGLTFTIGHLSPFWRGMGFFIKLLHLNYHPQISSQVELFNREFKNNLKKPLD